MRSLENKVILLSYFVVLAGFGPISFPDLVGKICDPELARNHGMSAGTVPHDLSPVTHLEYTTPSHVGGERKKARKEILKFSLVLANFKLVA